MPTPPRTPTSARSASALPGVLPVINRRAVEFVIATGIAIEATIPERTQWERKNYFYPDLPKGYQISQYAIPLAANGRLRIETSEGPFTVPITRAHLEEDTAKLVHAETAGASGARSSLVDFNRSGAPLMEIVTEPDIRTAEQARRYAEELQLLLRAIGASDADMERGQMRVEANVSLRPRGTSAFGTRVEVKNMNSFRAVERAIAYEIERQGRALDAGEPLTMETRGWDDGRQATYHMRAKETSDDYRYFPEPDLPPLRVDEAWIAEIRDGLPELPAARRARYEALGLSGYDAAVLVADPGMRDAFDAIRAAGPAVPAKEVANFVTGAAARVAKSGGYNATGRPRRGPAGGRRGAAHRDRRRRRLTPGRAGAPRAPPRRRDAGRRPARRRRTRPDLGRHGAARARGRGHRREPQGRGGLPGGQARRRVLRRAGHEGNGGRGGCGPGDPAGARAPRRGGLKWDC